MSRSDLQQTTLSLHENKTLLEKLFATLHMSIAYMDTNFTFIRVNQAYAAADGREPAFFVGKNHFDLYPDAHNEARFRQVVASGEPYTTFARPFVFPNQPERGTTYWDWSLHPVHTNNNRVEGVILCLVNVTARVQSEEHYRTLIDHSLQGLVIYQDQQIVFANAAMCTLMGYSQEELQAFPPGQLNTLLLPAERATAIAQTNRVLAGDLHLLQDTFHVVRKDGAVRVLEIAATRTIYRGRPAMQCAFVDATEQHQTEQALRESEERFRILFEGAPDAIFLADPQSGKIQDVNGRACELLQRSHADIIGMHFSELHPPALRDAATTHFHDHMHLHHQQHTVHPTENALLRADGCEIPVEVLSQMVSINGKTLVQGIFRDISERKCMEQSLHESEERYRSVVTVMTEGIVMHDSSGAIVTSNASAERILGLTKEQLTGRTSVDPRWHAIHADGSPFLGETHPAMLTLRTGEPQQDVIMGIRKPDGTLTWISINSQPIFRQGKERPDMVVVSFADITARQQTEERLRESERRFRMLAENARDIIFRYRNIPNPGYEYISPSITSILGYTPEEYYANPELHEAQIIASQPPNLEASAAQLPTTNQEPAILHMQHKNGNEVWLEVHRWPIFDKNGAWLAIEGICRDITERRRRQQSLVQQQQALAALHERERLARELHDNLGQVLGYVHTQNQMVLDLLSRGQTQQARSLLDQLDNAVSEAQHDLQDFLLGIAPTRQPPQEGFFASLQHYLQRYECMHSITTQLKVGAELHDQPFAQMVETHLNRIIQEALANIRKHAHATAVEITFALAGEQVQMVIQDDGAGFDLEQQQAAIASGQACFGLHSMRTRANEIGGHLHLDTACGAGTRVIVSFPLQSAHTANGEALSVLLVDDHPLFLEGMYSMLASRGVAVVGMARNGQDGLQQARRLHPDVILMDIDMPICNGLEATRLIKAELPDTQIVMLTVSAEEDHLYEAIKSGASGYLLKNLDVGEFFTLLEELERGEIALSSEIARKVLHEFQQTATLSAQKPIATAHGKESASSADADTPLSAFQCELLALVAQGLSYREVGEQLGYSVPSIKRYMSDIIKTLQLRNRAAAIAYARKTGLV